MLFGLLAKSLYCPPPPTPTASLSVIAAVAGEGGTAGAFVGFSTEKCICLADERKTGTVNMDLLEGGGRGRGGSGPLDEQ